MPNVDTMLTTGGSAKADLTGKRFDHLVVRREVAPHIRANGHKVRQWECVCDCGNVRIYQQQKLTGGRQKSCGCKHNLLARNSNTIHGDSHTRLHNIWSGMRARCYNPNEPRFELYGARGITICDEWRNDYVAFRRWALENGYKDSLTIDRVDNDGPYAPWNCQWTTQKAQSNNTRRNHIVSAFGRTQTIAQWSEETGIAQATIRRRLKLGWSAEDALSREVRRSGQ